LRPTDIYTQVIVPIYIELKAKVSATLVFTL